jgi:hypothetical protein
MAKKTRFTFRTTEEFKARIARVAEALGLAEAVVGEAALEAVVAHVEKYGELTITIRIEQREKKEEPPGRVAPAPGSSGSPHKRPPSFPSSTEKTGLNEPEGQYPAPKKGNKHQ